MDKVRIILIILILLLGIGLRSIEVINRNFLFGFDQGRDYLDVRKIVVEKKPTLIGSQVGGGLGGIFNGPYYYYSLILPFLIFDGDPYGGLVLMFIFGITSLFLCLIFVRKKFGTKMALVASLLMGVALSAQSRYLWNPHPATFFILLVFWLVFKIPQNRRYFFWSTFSAGIIYGFDLAISAPLILSLFLYVLLILKIKDFKALLAGALGIILSHLPLLAFEARHGFMASKNLYAILTSLLKIEKSINFLGLAKNHLQDFWFNFQNTFLLNNQRLGFLLLTYLFIVILHYCRKAKTSPEKHFIYFLLILPLATFTFYMFLNDRVWGHYLVHLHLTYIFLFSFCFAKVKSPLARLVFYAFLILMLPGIFSQISRAYDDLDDYGGVAKIKGKTEALDFIYQDASGEEFNVLVFTPPVYDYAYRYLLNWYGGKKYRYVPGEEKKGIFYLWIEPDPQKPWSYQGWLETVIKTGEVLKEVTLPSGFIIQKRYEKIQ